MRVTVLACAVTAIVLVLGAATAAGPCSNASMASTTSPWYASSVADASRKLTPVCCATMSTTSPGYSVSCASCTDVGAARSLHGRAANLLAVCTDVARAGLLHMGSVHILFLKFNAISLPSGVVSVPPSFGLLSVPTRNFTSYPAFKRTASERMLFVALFAIMLLPRMRIRYRLPSFVTTGNAASAISASLESPVIPISLTLVPEPCVPCRMLSMAALSRTAPGVFGTNC